MCVCFLFLLFLLFFLFLLLLLLLLLFLVIMVVAVVVVAGLGLVLAAGAASVVVFVSLLFLGRSVYGANWDENAERPLSVAVHVRSTARKHAEHRTGRSNPWCYKEIGTEALEAL